MKTKKDNYDLLILFSPFWTPTLAPMGPALLKSYIKEHGFSAYTLDLNSELFNSSPIEFKKYWERC